MATEISISQSLVAQEEEETNNVDSSIKRKSSFFAMSDSKTYAWAFLIVLLFMCWLSLLIVGLSYDSSEYHEIVFGKKMVTAQDSLIIQVKPTLEVVKPQPRQHAKPTLIEIIIYILSTTPFNVALLAAISAMIGGLASNLTASNKYKHEWNTRIKPNSEEYRTYIYMTENPTVSMVRGFIVYLLVVTGAFLTNFTSAVDSTDKFVFAGATAPSYFKFAVTVTLLSYLVGYDPSRLKNLLNSINITKKEDKPENKEERMLEVLRRLEIRLSDESSKKNHDQQSNKLVKIDLSDPPEKSPKS